MRFERELRRASLLGVALLGLAACSKKAEHTTTAAASSAFSVFKPAAPVASGLLGVPDLVSKVVNPDNQPTYVGPSGSVRGIITVTGDAPAVASAHLAQIKGKCLEAREAYD